MRALLDSNVLARAVYSVGGPAEACVQLLSVQPHILIVSPFLLEELRRVLRYPRMKRVHGFDDGEIDLALAALQSATICVELREDDIFRIVPDDPDDDYVVAAAVVGGADVLCTRNRHLYHEHVIAFCRQHAVEIMDDVELLTRLRKTQE